MTSAPDHARSRCVVWGIAVASILIALTLPVIIAGSSGTSEAYDQRAYHLPVIEAMAETWPVVDIVNYDSATGPAYHYVLAGVYRFMTDDARVLQTINMLISAALIVAVFAFAARFVGAAGAFVLVTPLLLSKYVLSGAMWLTTDNAALLFVVLAVGGALLTAPTIRRSMWCGLSCAMAVSIRQIHIWSISPLLALAALASPMRRFIPGVFIDDARDSGGSADTAGTWWRAMRYAAAAVPAVVVLGVFIALWGGLMPPQYRELHSAGMNPAAYPFALATVGGFGVFYAVWSLRAFPPAWYRDRLMWCGLAMGVALAAVVPTTYDVDAGRWGGPVWELIRRTPAIADRSLLPAVMSGAGGAVLALMYRAAAQAGRGGTAALLLLTGLGFVLAQSMNSQAWQRYFEPIVLIWLIWLAALSTPKRAPDDTRPSRIAVAAIVLLAIGQVGLSCATVYRPVLAGG